MGIHLTNKRFRFTFFAAALTSSILGTASSKPVFAYGADGHKIVANLAELNLSETERGKAVLLRVKEILAPGETLADASVWPDRIKGGAVDEDSTALFARLQEKLGRENAHAAWHYANMPYKAKEYSLTNPGARSDDVVQMVRICALTLRDQKSPTDAPLPLTQREALRFLVHFVGDMQQPLHLGCGYIAPDAAGIPQFVLPTAEEVKDGKAQGDQGGNSLTLPNNGGRRPQRLHGYWDTPLVRSAMAERDISTYVNHLRKDITADPSWLGTGTLESWSLQWANDSLEKSKLAYGGITLTGKAERGWTISLSQDYEKNMAAMTETQLAKGGARLAQILMAALSPEQTAPAGQ